MVRMTTSDDSPDCHDWKGGETVCGGWYYALTSYYALYIKLYIVYD